MLNGLEKKLVDCIDLNKVSVILVEDLILATIKKVVEDSANPFDNSFYEMFAPIAKVKGEQALAELIAKLKE